MTDGAPFFCPHAGPARVSGPLHDLTRLSPRDDHPRNAQAGSPMRTHGTLRTWNDARGFGFVEPAGRTDTVFVHITAFPHDGRRPVVGELVSFRIETDRAGRQRAVDIMRPGRSPTARLPSRQTETSRPRPRARARTGNAWLPAIALLAAIGGVVWHRTTADRPAALPEVSPAASGAHPFGTPPSGAPFRCDGRTRCSQMHSCAEATYFIQHCAGTAMDGDGDGVPCESQWCKAGS